MTNCGVVSFSNCFLTSLICICSWYSFFLLSFSFSVTFSSFSPNFSAAVSFSSRFLRSSVISFCSSLIKLKYGKNWNGYPCIWMHHLVKKDFSCYLTFEAESNSFWLFPRLELSGFEFLTPAVDNDKCLISSSSWMTMNNIYKNSYFQFQMISEKSNLEILKWFADWRLLLTVLKSIFQQE